MGKPKKPKQQVTLYYMSIHFGISVVVDALLEIFIKEKTAWRGEVTTETAISINNEELFGGLTKEGGVIGTARFLPGGPAQLVPDSLAQKMGRANGSDCPGYRGVASIYFTRDGFTDGFYWGANVPFIPPVWVKVRRAPLGLDPQYALIARGTAATNVLVAYDAFWDYQELGSTLEPSDFASIEIPADGYDLNAQAPFGVKASGLFNPPRTIVTPWPKNTSRWFRRLITLSQPANLKLDGFIENGIVIWVDGNYLFSFEPVDPSTRGGPYEVDTGILQAGSHVISILATDEVEDYGTDNTFWDMQITQEIAEEYDANPAHIIYECLTNTDWGMGSPAASIDYAAFDAASQTLFAEDFGLSLKWTSQASIEDFVQEILDHIQAVLFIEPSTGLLTLKLIRGDYVVGTLPELNPDNSVLTSFSRKLWGEIVNEIVVTWTNPENENDETITVHDDASIAMQGGVVSDSRNYYGVRTAALAQDLAYRDLRSAGQPLAKCDAEIDRSQYALRPASVVKVTWPEYGITDLVMRVTSVDYGKPGDPTIKATLIEDVYGLDIGTYDDPPTSAWVDPTAGPEPIETVEIFTMPIYFAGFSTLGPFLSDPEYPEVVAGVLASTDNADTFNYELWDEVALSNGSTEWQLLNVNNIIGRGELVAALDPEVSSSGVQFQNTTGQTSPAIGGFIIIGEAGETGNEIAMVETANGAYSLTRGVLDTVPRAWPAGTPCWFVDVSVLFEDSTVRAAAETVDYKLLSRTSLGLLSLGVADLESYTLSDRPWLPNRPANVVAHGEAFSTQASPIDARSKVDPWITVGWSNRNRLTEDSQVLAWSDADVTPETGQTTTIQIRDASANIITTHDGLIGTTFNVPDASFGGKNFVEIRVYSERSDADGDFVSLQYFSHWVQLDALTFDSDVVTFDSNIITMDQN